MKISRSLISIIVILLLLMLGWINFRAMNLDTAIEQTNSTDDSFRAWFWTHRKYDLLLQIVLIFGGMLSIAAILPIKERHE